MKIKLNLVVLILLMNGIYGQESRLNARGTCEKILFKFLFSVSTPGFKPDTT